MKKITLLQVTLEELDWERPLAGSEVALRGDRYRVVQAKPVKGRSAKWQARRSEQRNENWQLLVEMLEGP